MRRKRTIIALFLIGGLLSAATFAAGKRDFQRTYNVRDGARIYADKCALCHLDSGKGKTNGVDGFPPLVGLSEWMALREGQLYVAHAIVFGPYSGVLVGDHVYEGLMPRFGPRLDDQQIAAVMRYIAEVLNKPAPGYVPVSEEIVREARALPDDMDSLIMERFALPPR